MFQAEAAIVAHVKATHKIIQYMESSDKEVQEGPSQPQPPAAPYSTNTYPYYNQTSPSDVPQDMSLSNLNYSMNYNSTSSSDRMSSSMEVDGYHWKPPWMHDKVLITKPLELNSVQVWLTKVCYYVMLWHWIVVYVCMSTHYWVLRFCMFWPVLQIYGKKTDRLVILVLLEISG